MKEKIKILIVDDHFIVRIGLRTSINTSLEMCVTKEASTAAQAIDYYRKEHPDIVLMDVRLPDISGIQATTKLRHEFPQVKCITICNY